MAKIIADSVAPSLCRLTTAELRLPKCLLAEFNTHRMLSRNAASSRAIPVKRVMDQILNDPYIPSWTKNQAGMQGYVPLSPQEQGMARERWLRARDYCVQIAAQLSGENWWYSPDSGYFWEVRSGGDLWVMNPDDHINTSRPVPASSLPTQEERDAWEQLRVHKQFTNRLLEAWMYADVVTSGTDFQQLFHLRDHHMAHPDLAAEIGRLRRLFDGSVPRAVPTGEYHLPYIYPEDRQVGSNTSLLEWSTARCARVSLENQDGKIDREGDSRLYYRLLNPDPNDPDAPLHSSPTEHPARALSVPFRSGNFVGWEQHRKTLPRECRPEPVWSYSEPGKALGFRSPHFILTPPQRELLPLDRELP